MEVSDVVPCDSAVVFDELAAKKAERKRRREEKQRKKRLAKEKKAGRQQKGTTPAEAARAAADALVQSTNDFSIKSKRSMARKGYITDDTFGKYFVDTRANRAPLINRAYYSRAAAVRHAVDIFLREHSGEDVQICSLGAGFDTTFFRLAEKGLLKENDLFIEIDFPDLMAKKEAVINTHPDMLQWVHGSHVGPQSVTLAPSTAQGDADSSVTAEREGKECMKEDRDTDTQERDIDTHERDSDHSERDSDRSERDSDHNDGNTDHKESDTDHKESDLKRRRLVTISADLSDLDLLEREFSRHGVSRSRATLLLSECVMTYMSPESSSNLIQWAATYFTSSGGPGAVFVVYEQTTPTDPFGKIMVRHFKKFGSPLRCIGSFPSYDAYEDRYSSLGWTPRLVDLNRVFMSLVPEEERQRVQHLEPFDEHEELHAKCAHYFLLVAVVKGCLLESRGLLDTMVGARDDAMPEVGEDVTREELLDMLAVHSDTTSTAWECSAQDERWETKLRRWGHDSCLLEDGDELFVVGGAGGINHARLNDVVRIHTKTLGIHTIEAGGKAPSARMYHSCTAWNGGILVFGGRFGPQKPFNDLYLFHRCKDSWEKLDTKGTPPSPRWRHTATLTPDGANLLVIGGRDNSGSVTDVAHVLDLSDMQWRALPLPSVTPRYSHSATLVGEKVIVIGGLTSEGVPLGDVWELDCSSWMWEELYSIVLPEGRGGRYSHSALPLRGGNILCVGGSCTARKGIAAELFAIFDVGTRQWRRLGSATLPTFPDLPVMLYNHTCHQTPHGIVIVGGGGNCVSFGTHFNPFCVALGMRTQ